MSMSMSMNMEMDMEKRQKREARLHKRIQRALDMTGNIYSKKIAADKAHMVRNHPVQSMPDFIPEYFNEQYGFFMKEKDAGVCQAASKVYTVQHGGLLGSCYHGHSPISIENPGR